MRRSQSWLTIALFFTALLIIVLLWTALASTFLGFLYRNSAGLTTVRALTQISAILTGAFLFATAIIIAIPVAFQPGNQLQKTINVIPLFLLLFTLVGVIANLVGMGTTGTLVNLENGVILNFSSGWVAVGLILTAIAVVIATARIPLRQSILLNAVRAASATGILGVIAAGAMVASVIIVSGSQPSFGFPGGPAPQASGTQQAQGTEPAGQLGRGTGQGRQGGVPAAQGTEPAGQGSRPGGEGGPGPGGAPDLGRLTRPFTTGGIIVGILGVIVLISVIGGTRSLNSLADEADALSVIQTDDQHGGRSVLISLVTIGVIVLLAIQLVPVTRDNPPATTTIQWDTPQTQQLFQRACANCHSNTTVWPWYAYVAPSSWLTTMHVHSGRQMYNFSENTTAQLARFAQNAPMALRTGEMPPTDFLLLHPEARLSDTEKQDLVDGLQKTFPRPVRQQGFNLNGF